MNETNETQGTKPGLADSRHYLTQEANDYLVKSLAGGKPLDYLFHFPTLPRRDDEGRVVKIAGKVQFTGTSIFRASLRKRAELLGRQLTLEEIRQIVGADEAAVKALGTELVECYICNDNRANGVEKELSTTFVPIRVAILGEKGELKVTRQGEEVYTAALQEGDKLVYAGSFVLRILDEEDAQHVLGVIQMPVGKLVLKGVACCGSPFNNRSHLDEMRENKVKGGKPYLAQTYEDLVASMESLKASMDKKHASVSAQRNRRELFMGKRKGGRPNGSQGSGSKEMEEAGYQQK